MWDRGREELNALGVSPQAWLHGWKDRIARKDALFFEHAILGCDWEKFKTITTSFQASRSFEEPGVGRRVTRELRKAIPELMSERKVHTVHTYSLCIDPGAEKWFRLLGLEEDTDYKGAVFGGYTMRRFIRRA